MAIFFPRFEQHNLKLFAVKSQIGAMTITFLGHCITPEARKPTLDKVPALANMPMPKYVPQLISLLSGLGYYHQHLLNLARTLKPLTTLFKRAVKFDFTPDGEDSST